MAALMSRLRSLFDAVGAKARAHAPSRESLEQNRWLRPVAHHLLRSELWRFNRRSVPRGIALGFFTGIAVPFAHTPIAMLIAVGLRANVPVAAAATWISNPFTWVLMFPVAYRIGRFLIHVDVATGLGPLPGVVVESGSHHMLHRLAGAGAQIAAGLAVEAVVVSALGYALATLLWRLRVARRRQRSGVDRARRAVLLSESQPGLGA